MIPDKNTLQAITCIISDVDGVLTNGGLTWQVGTEPLRTFHIHDGLGIKRWQQQGHHFAIITAKESKAVTERFTELGVKHIYQGQHDKNQAYLDLKNKLGVTDHQCAYIGDDLPDLVVMQQVGFSVAPANAVNAVKQKASHTLSVAGGQGAVRALCDLLLEQQA